MAGLMATLEPPGGFEPSTCCLRNSCSTPELRWQAHSWIQQFRSQNADEPTALIAPQVLELVYSGGQPSPAQAPAYALVIDEIAEPRFDQRRLVMRGTLRLPDF